MARANQYVGEAVASPEAGILPKKPDDNLHTLSHLQQTAANDATFPMPENALPKTANPVLRWFIVTDILALCLSFIAAWLLSAMLNTWLLARTDLNNPETSYAMLALEFGAVSSSVLIWFLFTNHYQSRFPFWMEVRRVIEALGYGLLISCFLEVINKEDFSRLWLLSAWVFSAIGIIAFRAYARTCLRALNKWSKRAIIVGDGNTAHMSRAALAAERSLGYDIVGHVKDLPQAYSQVNFSWTELLRQYDAEHVIVAIEGEDIAPARFALSQLMREQIEFSAVPSTHNFPVVGVSPQFFLGQDIMLMICNNGLEYPLPRFLKRAFDILISSIALIVSAPIIAVLAFMVTRDGGKAFYGHKRIGLNGRVFSCLKLRSMVMNGNEVLARHLENNPDARAEWQREHKLRIDPRVTRIGAFMRRTSLDELPQFWNVLCGDMSIVGPRPIIVAEMPKYDNDIVFYYRVRPGITGLWQVSGRNDVTYTERVRMDSWYVRNWSLWHDIVIVCKTFGVLLNRSGAY